MQDPVVIAVADVARCLTIGGAIWLMALLSRLLVTRARMGRDERRMETHPFAVVSYVILLGVLVVRRAQHLGDTPDGYLIATTLAVVLGIAGTVRRVYAPPGRRHRAP